MCPQIPPLPLPREGASAFALDRNLVVLGGYGGETADGGKEVCNTSVAYDPRACVWIRDPLPPLPDKRLKFAVSVLDPEL